MFEQRLLENVKEGEEVVALVRRTPLVSLGANALTLILIIAPFFFLYPLLKLGAWGAILIAACLFFGILIGLRTLWVQQLNAFILTEQRIIDVDQRGFFHRVVSETTYDKVQDVSYVVKGILPTILRYGSVVVQTAGSTANLELQGVHQPQRIQDLILRMQRETASNKSPDHLSADDLLAMIQRIKAGIGDEQFRRLVANRPRKQV